MRSAGWCPVLGFNRGMCLVCSGLVWSGLLATTHFRLPHADSWCRSAVLRYGAAPRGILDANCNRIGVAVAVAVGVRLTGQRVWRATICGNSAAGEHSKQSSRRRCLGLGLVLGSHLGLSLDFGG